MGGFRWMSVGRSRSRSRCAWPQLSSMSLSLSLKLKKRGNVGARDSEWKKSAPIRGNKWLVIAAEAADDGGGREREPRSTNELAPRFIALGMDFYSSITSFRSILMYWPIVSVRRPFSECPYVLAGEHIFLILSYLTGDTKRVALRRQVCTWIFIEPPEISPSMTSLGLCWIINFLLPCLKQIFVNL